MERIGEAMRTNISKCSSETSTSSRDRPETGDTPVDHETGYPSVAHGLKRWAYVTMVCLSPYGSQSIRIMESCRVLAQLRPTLLFAPAPPPEPIPHLGYYHVPLPSRPPREMGFQLRLARSLLSVSRNDRPDVLYVRAASFNLGAIVASRILRIPCILEINGITAIEYRQANPGARTRFREGFYSLMNHIEWPMVDGLVTVTDLLGDIVKQRGGRKVLVASNGVNLSRFTPGDRRAAREQLGLAPEAEIIGFVGNFAPWQGLDTLIEAMILLAPQRPALQLLLVGGGDEEARLRVLAAPVAERVHFVGPQPHQRVSSMLSACDVVVAPLKRSPESGFGFSPLKVFEYLAMERVVICSRHPGLEFIERERVGSLFPQGDASALAKHIVAVLDLPEAERRAMERRARQVAERDYSWEHIIKRIVAFAENV